MSTCRSRCWPPMSFWLVANLLAVAAGCQLQEPLPAQIHKPEPAIRAEHSVVIHRPAIAPRVATGTVDEKGQPVTVACATCHATRPAETQVKLGKRLVLFHQKVTGVHGDLTCVACHNSSDGYNSLHLADGRRIEYADVMTLCAQCHGPQYRDYQHGAHGGMTGYWDLTRGSRSRNNCIDCHNPHVPRYPTVSPLREPNDRFLTGGGHG